MCSRLFCTTRHVSVCLVAAVLAFAVPPPAHAKGKQKPRRLTLAQIMAKARNNPLSRAAREATLAARAKVAEARGARWGKLSVTSFLAPSPDIVCIGAEPAPCAKTGNTEVSVSLAGVFTGVNATWTLPLYTFGKLGAVTDAAKNAVLAMRAKERQVAGRVALEVGRVYYGLKLARELRWMLEDGRDQIKKAMKKLVKHLAAGTGGVTVQDKLRLDTLLAEVDGRLVDAKAAETIALAGIRLIVKDKTVDIDEGELEPTVFILHADVNRYVARARRDHPQLDAARAGLAAVKALERLESRKWLPDLALVGGVGYSYAQGVKNAPSAFYNDPYNTLGASLGLVLRWNFAPLMTRARVRHAEANTRRASAMLDAATLVADLTVTRAHTKARLAQQKLIVTKRGEKSAKGWVASVLQAEAIGVISAKDTADAYVAYFTARARVVQGLYAWNLSVINLRRAVGEFAAAHRRRNK